MRQDTPYASETAPVAVRLQRNAIILLGLDAVAAAQQIIGGTSFGRGR